MPDTTEPDPFLEPEAPSTLEAIYTVVDVNPRLPDADFMFTPPAGAKEKQAESPALAAPKKR